MGKKTKLKQREAEEKEQNFQLQFMRQSACAKQKPAETPLVDELDSFRARFFRDPDGFDPKIKSSSRNKKLHLLVRHVFGPYSVPSILHQAWEVNEPGQRAGLNLRQGADRGYLNTNVNLRHYDFKEWYVSIASGKSFYKEFARYIMTKQEAHLFLNCPHQLTLPQAMFFAVGKATGARDGVSLRLARSKISEQLFEDFWKDVVRFFAQTDHHPVSVDQTNDLVDYLIAKRRENPGFRIFGMGHTLPSLLRKMKDWHHELRRLRVMGDHKWEGHALNDDSFETEIDGWDYFWDFRQIKTSKDLAAEGTAMRHCVYGYRHGCISGEHSIWSLSLRNARSQESKRKITIELRNNGQIAQKRGLANRAARPEENHVINLWARKNGLGVGY